MSQTLTERTRIALKRLHQDRKFSQTKVASRLRVDPSAVSRTLSTHGAEDRNITLEFLEAVADEAHISIPELLADPKLTLKELNAEEAALLRALRTWPLSVTRALCAFVAFFADEPPVVGQTRNLHELWRGMGSRDRDWLYGVAVMLREHTLAPDLQAGLEEQLLREASMRKLRPKGKHREP